MRDWLDAQAETLFLCSVTIAELMYGIGALPKGKRKANLAAALDGVLQLFDPRVLPFDTEAARRYAELAVKARAAGRGFPTPDGYIAAIAAAHQFAVASRDTSAFITAGLRVIDPWTANGWLPFCAHVVLGCTLIDLQSSSRRQSHGRGCRAAITR